MLFREFNFDDEEIAKDLAIDARKHSPTWEQYYVSYTYAIEKLIEKCLKGSYAFDSKARVIMFLLRHGLELIVRILSQPKTQFVQVAIYKNY